VNFTFNQITDHQRSIAYLNKAEEEPVNAGVILRACEKRGEKKSGRGAREGGQASGKRSCCRMAA